MLGLRVLAQEGAAFGSRVAFVRRLSTQPAPRFTLSQQPMQVTKRFARGVARPSARAGAPSGMSIAAEGRPNYLMAGLAGAGVLGLGFVGASMVGGMVKGATTVGTHSVWSPLQRERIQKTFAAFGVGIAATAASSVLLYRVGAAHAIANTGLLGTLGMMAVVVGSSVVVHMVPPEQTVAKYGALMLFNTAIGLTLSPLCVLGGPLLARAAAMTAGVVGSLSFVAANSPSDQYLWMAGPLAMGLGAVFVASFGALLPGGAIASVMHKVWMYGGLALFSGMCLYDTARIVETARVAPTFDPVGMSLSIYMDAVNIFVRIAMLLSGGGNRKK